MKDRDSMINNHHHLQELQHQMLQSPNSDLGVSHDDFLDQFLSFVPPSAADAGASFPWAADDQIAGMVEDQPTAALASKMRQQQISNGAARVLMLQQQLLLSRGNGPMLHGDQNGVVDAQSFDTVNLTNDVSVKDAFNGFSGSLDQIPNQLPHFFHNQGGALQQSPDFSTPAAPAMSQPAVCGPTGGGSALGQPKPRVRARRGQATDPHSIAERLRRERIAERMKALQELVPNANKTDKASMLDEIIDYVKFLQLQVKVLSMSRLGGGAAVAPLVANKSPEGRNGNGMQTALASNSKEGMTTAAEQQVAKLMEEDMGSAMQYLQGKGLCLMPISLATAISTATSSSQSQNHRPLLPLLPSSINPLLSNDGAGAGPSSPSMSVLTAQSATINGSGHEASLKDVMAAAKPE